MSKILFFICLFILLGAISPSRVFAATQISGSLSVTGDFPTLSGADGPWYPGKTLVKNYAIENTGATSENFAVKAANYLDPTAFGSHLFLAITGSSTDYFGTLDASSHAQPDESIQSFVDTTTSGELILFVLPAASQRTLTFTFTFDPQLSGSEYQGKQLSFDLSFGYSVTISPTPTITPTAAPTPTESPGPTATPGPGPTTTPQPAAAGATIVSVPAAGIVSEVGRAVAGFAEAVATPLGDLTKGVLGVEETTPSGKKTVCRNPWWGLIVLLIQSQIIVMLYLFAKKEWSLPAIIIQTAATLIALLILSLLFCSWLLVLLSGIIGVIGILLIYFR